MTALTPIPPEVFKVILEKYGFQLKKETAYNWTLLKEDAKMPIIVLPKKGELVSVDIMMGILDQLKINNKTYFTLLKRV